MRYLAILASLILAVSAIAAERLSLAGDWQVSLAGPEPAIPQTAGAPPAIASSGPMALPGTTDRAGLGPTPAEHETGGFTRVHKFIGAAWYRREIEIPAAWAGQRIELSLERSKYTQLWLDDRPLGERLLYTAPHVYDLTAVATPGRHTLTLLVDNRSERRPVPGQSHQIDDGGQVNWNGVLGALDLVATPPTALADVQVYPDVAARAFRVVVSIRQQAPQTLPAKIRISAESFNHAGAPQTPPALEADVAVGPDAATLAFNYPLGADAKRWDEFSPALYRVTVALTTDAGRDERTVETGLREFRARGRDLTINGRPTYLRGKHDAGIFPLEGHPPMTTEAWVRYLRMIQAWGFNHIRCHTWVPPEAAFAAADRLGMYLQPELPYWGTFDAKVRDFLTPEADAALRAYGNHPSFVMMTLGNEIGGDRAIMNAMVAHLRALDGRHLYADGSNAVLWDPVFQPSNDFMVSAKMHPPADPTKTLVARGSFCVFDGDEGHTQWGPSDTRADLSAALAGLPVPFLGHETGQWTVYPDYAAEIARYTGVTRAFNLERFQASLARHGMAGEDQAFQRASGALSAELYREEAELFRRTPETAGYQVLDLLDNPEQGTALVGMLDAMGHSKGLITPERYAAFNGPIVPVARFDRYTWTTADTYVADLQLSHYGRADLRDAVTTWSLVDAQGRAVARGAFPATTLAQGGLRDLGRVSIPLHEVPAPARYDLAVTIASGAQTIRQTWPVWVYLAQVDTAVPADVTLIRAYDATAKAALAAGKRVVLIPAAANWADTLPGAYATDYWNWPMFNNTPGTMGLLIDATHPALAQFPTATHSERQWADLAHASTPVLLYATPADYRPLVQVIDNYERNEKLGLVFEAQVGPGRLLVCAVDLLGVKLRDRPEAKQLLASLLGYAGGDAFAPKSALTPATLDVILRPSLARGPQAVATASSCFTPPWGFVPKPMHAFDGDLATKWFPAEGDKAPWLAVDLGAPHAIDTIEIVWEYDEPGYAGTLETSADGTHWTPLAGTPDPAGTGGRTVLHVSAREVRHLRLAVTATPPGRRPAVRELRVLGAD